MTPRRLGVWLHGLHVAEITSPGPGKVRCHYTPDALDAFDQNAPLLSCSLPLSARPLDGSVFFAGLLPEGQALQAMAGLAGLATVDTFGLLARFGRDVAGAAIIAAEPPEDRPGSVEPYRDGDLDAAVEALPERPLGLQDDSELSLAGLQDKLLLVQLSDGGWGRPVHGRPSTHILKVEDRRHPGLVSREVACLRLARALGLTAIEAWTETRAGIECLVVSRFDRSVAEDGAVVRVHQEDACQALGRDPNANDRRGKYHDAGGPDFGDLARLLDRWADDPIDQLGALLRIATFTAAIGNADAHGKNLALLHREPAAIELAPLYDTVPTVLWPKLRRDPAMPFGPRVSPIDGVTGRDLTAEARSWRLDPARARSTIETCLDQLRAAVEMEGIPDDLARLVLQNVERIRTTF